MKKLLTYLKNNKLKHELLKHRTVYTAHDLASTLRVKLQEVAKNLFVQVDRDYFIVVLPASHNLNIKKFQQFLKTKGYKAKAVKIPTEQIMSKILKLKKGSLNAFGSLYKLPVIVEKNLFKNKKMIMSLGSFTDSLKVAAKDYEKMEKPLVGLFGEKRKLVQEPKKPTKKRSVKKSTTKRMKR